MGGPELMIAGTALHYTPPLLLILKDVHGGKKNKNKPTNKLPYFNVLV